MKFYDTSSLIEKIEMGFEDEKFAISSITLSELERIKESSNKNEDIKFAARQLINYLDNNSNSYITLIFKEDMLNPAKELGLIFNDDLRILMSAYEFSKTYEDTIFVTNDICLKKIAELFFDRDKIESVKIEKDNYCGYLEVHLSEEEMASFYQNMKNNVFDLYINEYLIIYNLNNEVVDTLRWTGEEHKSLKYGKFDSFWFGEVKPFKNDIYQAMVVDSLLNNKITLVKGPAGTGKSYLSMGYLLHLLDKGKIDKIVVFCNTVAAKGAAKLGFYPGDKDEKLLDSQIGNMLASKLGDKEAVLQMIDRGQLILLPMADVRGYDTTGMNAGLYITEAQNLDITLMKLALQRIGEDCICILDGDEKTQVDLSCYEGKNNGMKRVSKIFRGEDIYGEIELKNIHRSRIAQIAEKL